MTKSNKIGYVAAFPIPELIRHINAFARGIKEVNPAAQIYVKWIYIWYGPDKAREAAEDRIAVIDSDLGKSGSSTAGREGFKKLVSEVGMGNAGIVIGLEVSRLACNS